MRSDNSGEPRGHGHAVRPRRRSKRHRLQRRFSKRKVGQILLFAIMVAIGLAASYVVSRYV